MKRVLIAVMLLFGACVFGETNEVARAQMEKAPARVQCEALTKSGTQCKRKALSGGKLCRQHQKIADKKTKSE